MASKGVFESFCRRRGPRVRGFALVVANHKLALIWYSQGTEWNPRPIPEVAHYWTCGHPDLLHHCHRVFAGFGDQTP